jgi:hypothetical protein
MEDRTRTPTRRFLIGVGGQYDSGKDTVADYLAVRLNELRVLGHWERDRFSEEIKETVCRLYGVDREFIEHWKRIPYPPPGWDKNVRDLMIYIGDGLRKFKWRVWVDQVFKKLGHRIISDNRYRDESRALKREGGVTLQLWRPDRVNEVQNDSEQDHRLIINNFLVREIEGVTHHKLVDLFILNNGTLSDLYDKLDVIVIPFVLNRFRRS